MVVARRVPRRADRDRARRRQSVGHAVHLRARRSGAARAPAARSGAPCRTSVQRFFVMYGDSYLECDFADVERVFVESRRSALMTVYRNEGQFDTSNVEFENGRIVRYDKKVRTESMHHIDWGLGVFQSSAFDRIRRNDRSISQPSTRTSSLPVSSPVTRCRTGSMKSDLQRESPTPTSTCGERRSDSDHDLHRTSSAGSRGHPPAARSRGHRTHGRDPGRRPCAGRPALLPRRRRQCRQLRPRGQRFPQAGRLRGLRADRQRLGADRADQRRGMGHRVRRHG